MVDQKEEQYKKDLAEAGVELPELEETPEDKKEVEKPAEVVPEVIPEKKVETEVEEESETEEKPDLTTTTEEKPKRSIYQEYKDQKKDLRTEKELRLEVEKERDEYKTKLDALLTAKTPEEKKIATDDLEEFAKEIDADPATIKKMRELFLKDVKTEGLSEEDREALQQAKQIIASQSVLAEKQAFAEELNAFAPTLKEMFPNASDEEMQAVRKKLDEVAHKPGFNDKELDYVVFKHKEELTKLVSPKVRGMEGKGKKDAQESNVEFDPNADYSKMSPEERAAWEAEYSKLGKSEGLETDTNGRKILI